jgi:membrane protein involved in colicin uptake
LDNILSVINYLTRFVVSQKAKEEADTKAAEEAAKLKAEAEQKAEEAKVSVTVAQDIYL